MSEKSLLTFDQIKESDISAKGLHAFYGWMLEMGHIYPDVRRAIKEFANFHCNDTDHRRFFTKEEQGRENG